MYDKTDPISRQSVTVSANSKRLQAIAFIPLFGFLNWFVIPFAAVGMALGFIAKSRRPKESGQGRTGFFCSTLALCLSIFRLLIGGGIF